MNKAFKLRLAIVFIGILFAFAILASRAFYFQVIGSPRLERLANRQFNTTVYKMPRRGDILDRNKKPLATSLEVKSVYINPSKVRAPIYTSKMLAKILKMTPQNVLKKLKNKNKSFVWVKRHITDEEEAELLEKKPDAIGFISESQRVYPNKELAAHILGHVSIDSNGVEGFERKFDKFLAGEVLKEKLERDAKGRALPYDGITPEEVRNGDNFILTIDKTLQYLTEEALKETVKEFDALGGSVVIMNAENGEVLSLANYPTFDPNEVNKSTAEQRRNRAVTDQYEPGSTFKTILMASALSHGMTPNTKFYCENGQYKIGKWTIKEALKTERFEWLPLADILKFSSNIGSAKVAIALGPEKYLSTVKDLGFGEKTGIDLPNETSGKLYKSAKDIKQINLATFGFGQSIAVTVMQMATSYAIVANGGHKVQPFIVKEVQAPDGKTKFKRETTVSKQVLSEKVTKDLVEMMGKVTEVGGTGTKANVAGFPIAGKTGTAQKIVNGRYAKGKYFASFMGFSPNTSPLYVFAVVLDEPKKKFYGGEVAAPLFNQVAKVTFAKSGFEPKAENNKPLTEENARDLLKSAFEKQENSSFVSASSKNVMPMTGNSMPSLVGLSLREAMTVLSSQKIQIKTSGTGIVIKQTPQAGTSLNADTEVTLILQD